MSRYNWHGAKTRCGIWPEYRIWYQMIQRCTNPGNVKFAIYGARGITVCERWRNFPAFIKDMGRRPSKAHTLGRVDNNSGYCPDNCQWESRKQQARNRRTNRVLTAKGKTQTLAEWAEELGVSQSFLGNRVRRKWTDERAITEPKFYRGG